MTALKQTSVHGHRGCRGLYPENTLTAFIEAVKLGVTAIEMDVIISKDLQVVVSHEAWMNSAFCTRPNGQVVENDPVKYNLYNMPYAEIAAYDCGKLGNADFPHQKAIPEHKPLLQEVIEKVETYTASNGLKPVVYNIEIKTEQPDGLFNPAPPAFVELVLAVLKNHAVADRYHLQSFDAEILKELKQKDAGLSLGFLVENKADLQENLNRLGFIPNAYSPDFELANSELVKEVHTLGMQFIPWTVNEAEDMRRMLVLGANGIISDYPDRALALIRTQ